MIMYQFVRLTSPPDSPPRAVYSLHTSTSDAHYFTAEWIHLSALGCSPGLLYPTTPTPLVHSRQDEQCAQAPGSTYFPRICGPCRLSTSTTSELEVFSDASSHDLRFLGGIPKLVSNFLNHPSQLHMRLASRWPHPRFRDPWPRHKSDLLSVSQDQTTGLRTSRSSRRMTDSCLRRLAWGDQGLSPQFLYRCMSSWRA